MRAASSRRDFFAGAISTALASCLLVSCFMTIGVDGPARADSYPDRPVKIIVPFPAGGTADAVPRIVGDFLSRKWGQ